MALRPCSCCSWAPAKARGTEHLGAMPSLPCLFPPFLGHSCQPLTPDAPARLLPQPHLVPNQPGGCSWHRVSCRSREALSHHTHRHGPGARGVSGAKAFREIRKGNCTRSELPGACAPQPQHMGWGPGPTACRPTAPLPRRLCVPLSHRHHITRCKSG